MTDNGCFPMGNINSCQHDSEKLYAAVFINLCIGWRRLQYFHLRSFISLY